MKILITGGAGFIGSNLTEFHLEKNDEIYVIDNFITGNKKNIEPFLKNSSYHFTQGDVRNFVFSTLPSFDIVYHLASPASPIQYKKYPIETLMVNGMGTYNLLEFFKISKSKVFIFSSTSEIYGDPQVHPQPENYWGNVNPVGTRSCYDEAKRFAEALIYSYFRKNNLDLRIARIFNTYGPNMEKNDGRVVSNFIMQALQKKPITIYGDGRQTRSFCFVSDMIKGLYQMAIAHNIAGEIINLGNPDEKTIIDLAKIIKRMTNSESDIVNQPIEADDPKKRKPDITKAKELLCWQPTVNLHDGLIKTIEYFKTRFL